MVYRIGHGVNLIQNPDLLKFVIDHNIAIECCVTSNTHTKAITTISTHPIRYDTIRIDKSRFLLKNSKEQQIM